MMEVVINQKRREIQNEAVAAAALSNYFCFILLPTGTGKAWVLIECLKRLNPSGTVWYLCDSEDNRDITFKDQLRKWGAEEWLDRIEFMCYQTAYKRRGEHVDLILADEVDFGLTAKYGQVFTNNTYDCLVAVSATMAANKRLRAERIAPVVYEKHLQEIEGEGILNTTKYYYVNFMLNKGENAEYLRLNSKFARLLQFHHNFVQSDLKFLKLERKRFLNLLHSAKIVCRMLMKELYENNDNKILIFCGLSEQADNICKYSYHGKSDENYLILFDKGDIRILTVVGKVDRGQNIDGVNNIIFESPSSSATRFFQRSGRGRRLHVNDTLNVFFLIPYYKDKRGIIRPTVVQKWVERAAEKLHFKPEIHKLKYAGVKDKH